MPGRKKTQPESAPALAPAPTPPAPAPTGEIKVIKEKVGNTTYTYYEYQGIRRLVNIERE